MTVSYFVRYQIEAGDDFVRHYQDHHVPILARWPGMQRVILHRPVPFTDPCPVNQGNSFLVAQLEFETQADLERALRSPERMEARRDFETFPSHEGDVFHEAMQSEDVWRKR